MELIDKARLIVEFTQEYFNDDEYADFFDYNDIGVPMAIMIVNQLVEITADGWEVFDETYQEMCNTIGCDYLGTYEDLQDMFDSLL